MIAMRRCYAISIIGMEGKNMNHNKKKILKVTALFVFMFFLGWRRFAAETADEKNSGDSVCPESGR
jgi:hypothetical protein